MKPREKRYLKTKQTILETALSLVIKKGPDNLSLREIAREAEYSPAGLYEYFTNKEEIIETLKDHGVLLLNSYLKKVVNTSGSKKYIEKIGMAYINFGIENPQYYKLIFSYPSSKRKNNISTDKVFIFLKNIFEDSIKEGNFNIQKKDSVLSICESYWSILHGFIMLNFTNSIGKVEKNDKRIKDQISLFLNNY